MPTRERPLSPHLQVYRWQITMTMSILHRATGVAITVGAFALAWWLMAVAAGGDTYRDALLETARLIAERAAIREWSFAFQSESPTGEPWLGPDILDHLSDLSAQGVSDVLVCPVGFVSDHLEIRWDIDTVAAERARELGLRLRRIELPNADPAFVQVLTGLVRRAAAVPSAR